MKEISKEDYRDYFKGSVDHISEYNNTNLRGRVVLLYGGRFLCIENNTSGWFLLNDNSTFSNAVYWLQSC